MHAQPYANVITSFYAPSHPINVTEMICTLNEDCDSSVPDQYIVIQTFIVTVSVLAGFVCTKMFYDNIRKKASRLRVVVVGAGPVGLTAALIAAQSGRAKTVTLVDEKNRSMLINRCSQVAFDARTMTFLSDLGIDFDNMEGCRSNGIFFTRSGVYQEYVLTLLERYRQLVQLRLSETFDKDCLSPNEGRQLVVVCDGVSGSVGATVGLSDDYDVISCKAYGAVAAIERREQPQIPTAEKRVHGLKFDLSEYETDTISCNTGSYNNLCNSVNSTPHPTFHFKLFGSTRNRYMSLAVPKCDNKVVKTMRQVLDRTMMRTIFTKCFNVYKSDEESTITESVALHNLGFSPRLYEVRMSQRKEVAAYYEDSDMFVVVEGDAARTSNFHTGMDINTAMRGLDALTPFLHLAAHAETDHAILGALSYKMRTSDAVCKQFVKNGLNDYFFT